MVGCGPASDLDARRCETDPDCPSRQCAAGFCVDESADTGGSGDAANNNPDDTDDSDGDDVGNDDVNETPGLDGSDVDTDASPDVSDDATLDAPVADTEDAPDVCWEDWVRCDGGICLQGECLRNPPGFVPIPPRAFSMGSPATEAGRTQGREDRRQVTLTRGVWVQTTEVTQTQWGALIDGDEFAHPTCPTCPAENMTWFAALRYANLRSESEGIEQCYQLDTCVGEDSAMTCLAVSTSSPYAGCRGYRLPSEAEWELAARAGTQTAFFAGDLTSTADCDDGPELVADPVLESIGHYCGNSSRPVPVGQATPSPWGFYDTQGNVAEWTYDAFFESLPGGTDPVVDYGIGAAPRTTRGGSYQSAARYCRSASRDPIWPGGREAFLGLRLVRTIAAAD